MTSSAERTLLDAARVCMFMSVTPAVCDHSFPFPISFVFLFPPPAHVTAHDLTISSSARRSARTFASICFDDLPLGDAATFLLTRAFEAVEGVVVEGVRIELVVVNVVVVVAW